MTVFEDNAESRARHERAIRREECAKIVTALAAAAALDEKVNGSEGGDGPIWARQVWKDAIEIVEKEAHDV